MERTNCDCKKCTAGCKTMPGALIPSDLPAIQQHVGDLSGDFVLENFRASEGPLVIISDIHGNKQQVSVPTIVPAQKENGHCVFLTSDEQCAIHAVAPFNCAYQDMHTNEAEAHRRSVHAVRKQHAAHSDGAPYAAWIFLLNQLGFRARPFPERKQAMADAVDKLEAAEAIGEH